MNIEIDASSLLKEQKLMMYRGDRIIKAIDTIIKKSLFLVERYAKIYSPVRTGRLRASIGGGSFKGGSFPKGEGEEFGRMYASIMPTVVYAKYVHRWTPFMTSAVYSSTNERRKIIENEIKEAIR